MIYEKSEEVKNPYTFVAKLPKAENIPHFDDTNFRRSGIFSPKILNAALNGKICSMSLNLNENCLVFTTDNH